MDQNTIAEEGEEDRINWTTSEEKPWIQNLAASNDVHSSGKKSNLLVVLSNEGSLTVKRKRCSLWRVLFEFYVRFFLYFTSTSPSTKRIMFRRGKFRQ